MATTKNLTNFDYVAYSRKMRQALSNEDIINANGDINHEYFLVKKGSFWSDKNEKTLIRALEIFGIFPHFTHFYQFPIKKALENGER